MNIDAISDRIGDGQGFERTIGMQFISTPDPDTCMAKVRIESHLLQPHGYMSGGVSISLAETLAGVGSTALCPANKCVGISVNANHVRSAIQGQTITALAKLIHKGLQLHVWKVDVTNDSGQLISEVTVTNFVKAQ